MVFRGASRRHLQLSLDRGNTSRNPNRRIPIAERLGLSFQSTNCNPSTDDGVECIIGKAMRLTDGKSARERIAERLAEMNVEREPEQPPAYRKETPLRFPIDNQDRGIPNVAL
jgi:hypothetical protein